MPFSLCNTHLACKGLRMINHFVKADLKRIIFLGITHLPCPLLRLASQMENEVIFRDAAPCAWRNSGKNVDEISKILKQRIWRKKTWNTPVFCRGLTYTYVHSFLAGILSKSGQPRGRPLAEFVGRRRSQVLQTLNDFKIYTFCLARNWRWKYQKNRLLNHVHGIPWVIWLRHS